MKIVELRSMARILIAEDDANIYRLIHVRLEHLGHMVSWASDGAQAIARAREEQPEVILLDVMMPIVDGFEVLRTLKQNQHTARIPVIMLTARGQEEDTALAMRDGAHSYVIKPFSFPALIATIDAALLERDPA
jgi:DNA-binding response OmpR family regulator